MFPLYNSNNWSVSKNPFQLLSCIVTMISLAGWQGNLYVLNLRYHLKGGGQAYNFGTSELEIRVEGEGQVPTF